MMKKAHALLIRSAYAALLLLAAPLSNSAGKNTVNTLSDGMVYIHTARNSPKFSRGGSVLNLSQEQLIKAGGLSVDSGGKQCAILVLSNRIALYLAPNTKLLIKEFKQTLPFRSFLPDTAEASRSMLELYVESGELAAYGLNPRVTSRLRIKTPSGTFEPRATSFIVKVTNDSVNFMLLQGRATFYGPDGKSDFIQSGQSGTVLKSDSKRLYPLKIFDNTLVDEERESDKISMCKNALRSIEFFFDADNTMKARKLLSKDFFMRRSQSN